MEVTSLCIRLLVNVLLLLTAQTHISSRVHKADAAFLHIDPNRLQFFEYESISLHCAGFDGPTEWRVMTNTSLWETSTGSLNIKPAYIRHSGEYWCENGDGERSNTVDVIVTAGDVILESPALPVMEQQTATLRCRRRGTSKNSADFFKDGRFIKTIYTGYMTIPNISMSDEGLYSCSISGAGGSAESRLAVTAHVNSSEESFSDDGSPHLSILLPVVFTTLCVAVLPLVVGLLLCQKDTVCGKASVADISVVTYTVVTPQTEGKRRSQKAGPPAQRGAKSCAVIPS